MKLHYISPSTIPSRTANSVHVIMQCHALIEHGVEVTLYAKRSVNDKSELNMALMEAYNVDFSAAKIVSYHSDTPRCVSLNIALLSFLHLHRNTWPDVIFSRNLYAAFVIGVVKRRSIVFETHQLEIGFRKFMQKAIVSCPWVTTIVISHKLLECLRQHLGIEPAKVIVLPDAARDGIVPVSQKYKRDLLKEIVPAAVGDWEAICGYFGQLYSGRGIEIIKAMATHRPHVLFLVFGGNEKEIILNRELNDLSNIIFIGHVPHPLAQKAMGTVDVLLMPYQENVSIGISGHDTARWMSPMKMFEYLASGVPIISSDLPVLHEVLSDGDNCLMANPAEPDSWLEALDRLIVEPALGQEIGERAHIDYLTHYTWKQRGKRILDELGNFF